MNKDRPVLKFTILEGTFGTVELKETERYTDLLPLGFRSIQSWIESRQAPKHREHIAELMRVCGCSRLDGFVKITHALSLNDTFWTKPEESSLRWDEVSLYKNEFDETIARIAFEGACMEQGFPLHHQNLKRMVRLQNVGCVIRTEPFPFKTWVEWQQKRRTGTLF